MRRNWILFQRSSENEQIHVFLDLHLQRHTEKSQFQYLLTLFVNIYHIAENEEQAKRIQKELNEIEEKLDKELFSLGLGVFAGRIDSATRLEYLFYVKDAEQAKSHILLQMEAYAAYRHYVQAREDLEWEFYSYLLPTQEEKMFARNSQILRSLEYEGFRTDVSQRVHHQLCFVGKQDLDMVKESLLGQDYRVEHIEYDPEGLSHKHKLHVSHVILISEPILNETTKRLYDMITRAGGKYEGWGIIPQEKTGRKWKQLLRRAKTPAILIGFILICSVIGLFTMDSKFVKQTLAANKQAIPSALAVGKKAPAIKLRDQYDNVVQIGGPGRAQVLNFCDASLEPCREDLKELEELANQAHGIAEVISVCFPHKAKHPAMEQASFQVVHDKEQLDTYHAYKVKKFPVTFFINSSGVIVDVIEAGKTGQQDRKLALQDLK